MSLISRYVYPLNILFYKPKKEDEHGFRSWYSMSIVERIKAVNIGARILPGTI
jgi:hypothetical protein